MTKEKRDRISLVLKAPMREILKAKAEKSGRSLNNYVEQLLKAETEKENHEKS